MDQQEAKRLGQVESSTTPVARPLPFPPVLVQLQQRGVCSFRRTLASLSKPFKAGTVGRRPLPSTLPVSALGFQQEQMSGVGAAEMGQGGEEAPQQLIQIARFQFHPEQFIEGLCFRFAHLVVGIVQSEDDTEVELLSDPLKVHVFAREHLSQERGQEVVVLLERGDDLAGGKIEFG